MTRAITVERVFKDLGGERVLGGVSLSAAKGEVLAVIGPSGCGKSTLLNAIAGLVAPDAGRIAIAPAEATVGYVFQHPRLLPWRSAQRNVEFGLEQRLRLPASTIRERAGRALELVGLGEAGAKLPHELSGGMQQRVALARALAIEPDVLLLDEPFASLDALTRADLQEELAAIVRRAGPTTVLVTHDIDEALLLADDVAVMSARPARIMEVVAVPFRGERSMESIVADARYPQLRATLRGLLRTA